MKKFTTEAGEDAEGAQREKLMPLCNLCALSVVNNSYMTFDLNLV